MRRALISAASLAIALSAAPVMSIALAQTGNPPDAKEKNLTPTQDRTEDGRETQEAHKDALQADKRRVEERTQAGRRRQALHRRELAADKRRVASRTEAGRDRQEQHRDRLEDKNHPDAMPDTDKATPPR